MKKENMGLKVEEEFINYIRETKYVNLMNENIKNFLYSIFDFDISLYEIKAYKYVENYKPDIIITANGFSRYISIKTGNNNSVHQEHIYSFLNFLSDNGVSETIKHQLRIFQFMDGSVNGSGKEREAASEYVENNQEYVQLINDYLNNYEIKSQLIDRFLFKGEYYNLPVVDYIYYGNINNGFWASRDEIISFLLNSKIYSSSIHISKLYYQTLHRNLKYDKYFEFKRYFIQIKWHSLKEDLEFITKKRKKA